MSEKNYSTPENVPDHFENENFSVLGRHAYKLLKSDPEYLEDARHGGAVGNTIVGSVMAITTGSPRWATENAVAEALARIDAE